MVETRRKRKHLEEASRNDPPDTSSQPSKPPKRAKRGKGKQHHWTRGKQSARKSLGYEAPEAKLYSLGSPVTVQSSDAAAPNIATLLPVVLKVKNPAKQKSEGDWCAGCTDGGDDHGNQSLLICDFCPRLTCSYCVPIPRPVSKTALLICPNCFRAQTRKAWAPYYGTVKSTQLEPCEGAPTVIVHPRTVSFFDNVSTPSLVIVTLHLADSPIHMANILHAQLAPWYDGGSGDFSLGRIDIPFNFTDELSAAEYDKKIAHLVKSIVKYKVVILLIITHSTPDKPNWHFAPGRSGAAPVEEVLGALFKNERFCEVLRQRQTEAFLSVCGGPYLNGPSWECVKGYIKRNIFSRAVAFTTPKFMNSGSYASTFLYTYVERLVFHQQSVARGFPNILADIPSLGAATSVLLLQRADSHDGVICTEYIWHHAIRRPYGLPISTHQCLACTTFSKPHIEVTDNQDYVTLTCPNRTCRAVLRLPIPVERRGWAGASGNAGSWDCVPYKTWRDDQGVLDDLEIMLDGSQWEQFY